MVTPLAVVALILTAIIGTILLWRINEPAVRSAVTWTERARWVFGLVFLTLGAYHLLRSGNPVYITAALIGFMFLTGYLLVERPWSQVI